MRRIFPLIILMIVCCNYVHAQREQLNPLVNSKEAIAKGLALHDAGKYTEAVAAYLKVPASDTGYATMLGELVLSFYKDSNYVQAEKYANLGMERFPEKKSLWFGLLADIYDDTKRTELALAAYDTVLAKNPYNYLTYFNKAITLFRQSRFDEATANFQQCVILNPYYSSAHYFLGQLAMLKGNMVQAMMSFATNMLVSPGNGYRKNTVSFLVTISEVNTTANEYLQKYKAGKQDNFDEIQDILTSKIALDKKYKLRANLEDVIVRQLQVVSEKLEYNANDKGFWMQYYVPLFKSLWDKNLFEPMVFYMFSELEIKNINEYVKKEKKKIESFSDATTGYLNEIRETHEILFNKRADAKINYFVKNYRVTGKGAYGKNAKNEDEVFGPWEFYFENGTLKSAGTFNSEGQRTGDWRYYHENGQLKELSNYKLDKANGRSLGWYDNGLPSSNTTYVDDKIVGLDTNYFYDGKLLSVLSYKDGEKDGIAKYYNIDGYVRTVENYKSGLLEGEEMVYYPNGKFLYTVMYANDKATGAYKEYFDNGKLKLTGNYAVGEKTGLWTTYFIDGKPSEIENFLNGELDGERISYYENGKVESKRFYKKGEIDGKKEDFDDDGIVFTETIFEKGRLRDIKFFDKKGGVISNTSSRKGNADISFYSPDGAKLSQGYYSKEGMAEGKFINYYKNGQVASEGAFKNGLQDGKKTFYYANGKVSQQGSYKEDKSDGYFINYYNNGQVSGEGWYVDDDRQGTFINYDLLGHLTNNQYYLNGKIHGVSQYYTPTGKLDYREFYDHGWFEKIDQFDSMGNIMVSSVLHKGEGKMLFNHYNGKPYIESNYKYYKLHGSYTVTNGDGSKRISSHYKNERLDSNYTAWYPNGKVQVEGKYAKGTKTGTWKHYYYNGQLSETENFVDGKLEGEDIQYNEDGSIDKKFNYKNGELNGELNMYGDKGELILVFFYKQDNLEGYSYYDKSGKLVPQIKLVKGSGILDSYYKNGIKSAHMTFNEGIVEGERTLYLTTGKPYVEGSRINGLEHGSKKIYYASGKLMKEENYYYGESHGTFKYYNENGTLISQVNYYLGSLHGECKYFTAGKPVTYIYYNGQLESKK